MEKIKISIGKHTVFGDAPKYDVYSSRNKRLHLFSFQIREWCNQVLFYPEPNLVNSYPVILKGGLGDDFPLEYFMNLTRSKYFIESRTDEWPEVELTKTVKKLLKIK